MNDRVNVSVFGVAGPKLLMPKRLWDCRGYFWETWSDKFFHEHVAEAAFVQENQSFSVKRGTVRGLHFQRPPCAQGKLVRVLKGSIYDVSVDVRAGSPTFGQHLALVLDASSGAQLWIPSGFLHGFCTLEDETEISYKVTAYYSAAHDAGVLWNDPDLGINWPVRQEVAILSDKDRAQPRFRALLAHFQMMETQELTFIPLNASAPCALS